MRLFWTTADLVARGRSKREIRRAIDRSQLIVVRRGLLTVPSAPLPLVRAARIGGVATSITAASSIGLWTPPDLPPGRNRVPPHRPEHDRLQVAVRRTTTRLHDPDDGAPPLAATPAIVVHRVAPEVVDAAAPFGVAPVLTMLEHAFRSLPPEHALAIPDSALHHRFLRDTDLAALAAMLPVRLRPIVLAADGRADSGIETIVRYLLRLAGLAVVVHPILDGIGEVDLLVAGRLIVECDGREFHDSDEACQRDRRRDLVAATTRYRSLRLTWWQVLSDWPNAEAAVFAALAH